MLVSKLEQIFYLLYWKEFVVETISSCIFLLFVLNMKIVKTFSEDDVFGCFGT